MGFSKSLSGSLLLLGLPLIGSSVAQFSLTIIDTAMLGHYNPISLAAVVIGGSFFFSFFIVGSGFAFAIVPLVAAYEAQSEPRKIRRITRMGLWMSVLYTGGVIACFLNSEIILIGIGQSSEIAKYAGDYLKIMGFGLLPALLVVTLRSFLTGLKHTQIILWVTLVGLPIKIFLNWVFIFGNLGMPELGVKGAAVTTAAIHITMLLLLIFYIQGNLWSYGVFNRLWRLDYLYLAKIFKLGLPIGLTYLAETSLFSATAIMMGWLGTVELAAHGITMQLAGLTFMFHVGMSQAATTITGQAFGKNASHGKLRDIGKATIEITCAYALLVISVFILFPNFLLSLFLDNSLPLTEQVLVLAVKLLMIAAVFHLVDGLQAAALGLLRGIQDVKTPFLLAILSYWLFGLGSGYLLAFKAGQGSIGLWIGMVIGLTFAATSLIWRYWRKTSK